MLSWPSVDCAAPHRKRGLGLRRSFERDRGLIRSWTIQQCYADRFLSVRDECLFSPYRALARLTNCSPQQRIDGGIGDVSASP